MKKIFYSLAVVCLALVSCKKEVSVVDEHPYAIGTAGSALLCTRQVLDATYLVL